MYNETSSTDSVFHSLKFEVICLHISTNQDVWKIRIPWNYRSDFTQNNSSSTVNQQAVYEVLELISNFCESTGHNYRLMLVATDIAPANIAKCATSNPALQIKFALNPNKVEIDLNLI